MNRVLDILPTFSTKNEHSSYLSLLELFCCGVRDFCIAPGSRNAPISIALSRLKQALDSEAIELNILTHYDERSLGFSALGIAKATRRVPVVIVTSGSAVANLFPSVVEAYQSGVGMILISADRPFELLGCGANQAMDQIKFFGNYAKFFDIPSSISYKKIPATLALMSKALEIARTQPVHINWHFQDPLYPINSSDINHCEEIPPDISNWLEKLRNTHIFSEREYSLPCYTDRFSFCVSDSMSSLPIVWGKRNIIILGNISKDLAISFKKWLNSKKSEKNSEKLVVIKDITCSSRLKNKYNEQEKFNSNILSSSLYSQEVQNILSQADTVVQVGGAIVSKALNKLIYSFSGKNSRIYFLSDVELDQNYQHLRSVSFFIGSKLGSSKNCFDFETQLPAIENDYDLSWIKSAIKHSEIAEKEISERLKKWQMPDEGCSEISQLHQIVSVLEQSDQKKISQQKLLFIGNSMPIRSFEFAGIGVNKNNIQKDMMVNRGVSGIDGLVSTFIGAMSTSNYGIGVLTLGDLSCLHDIGALGLLKNFAFNAGKKIIIVVFNNKGGAIFDHLPIGNNPQLQSAKTNFFQMPHSFNFQGMAQTFGLKYYLSKTNKDFVEVFNKAIDCEYQQFYLIEVAVEQGKTIKVIRDLVE